MKKKKKKRKLKKDRSISSFFEEHVKETSEVQSRVKGKKMVTGKNETELDSDVDSLSDETSPEGVGLGLDLLLHSQIMNVNRNPSRNHTLDFGRWSRGTLSYHIIFKERAGQTWSALLTNIKGIVVIPNRKTMLITYKLHGTNILLRETTFEAFGN